MSLEAMLWAMNLAPIPAASNGKPSSTCAAVLVGLANHANPDGTDAFPSIETLSRYTRLSNRAIQNALRALEEHGTIRAGDKAIVRAKIKRGDRQTKPYDLAVERYRDDLTEEELTAIARSTPMLRGVVAEIRASLRGVHDMHPADAAPADPDDDGVHDVPNGVHVVPEPGAPRAPEPSLEPTEEPALFGASVLGGAASPPATQTAQEPQPRTLNQQAYDVGKWVEEQTRRGVEFKAARGLAAKILADGYTARDVACAVVALYRSSVPVTAPTVRQVLQGVLKVGPDGIVRRPGQGQAAQQAGQSRRDALSARARARAEELSRAAAGYGQGPGVVVARGVIEGGSR